MRASDCLPAVFVMLCFCTRETHSQATCRHTYMGDTQTHTHTERGAKRELEAGQLYLFSTNIF